MKYADLRRENAELLEALANVVAAFDNYGQPERPESWERNLSYAVEDARAALAKAQGEADA